MMKQINRASKSKEITAGHKARKVGGIWVDPMSFPTLTA